MPANPPITSGLIVWLNSETGVTTAAGGRVTAWANALGGPIAAENPSNGPALIAGLFGTYPGLRFADSMLAFNTVDLAQTNFTVVFLGRTSATRVNGGSDPSGQRELLYLPGAAPYSLIISAGTNGVGIYENVPTAPRREAITDATVLCPLVVRYSANAPSLFLNGHPYGFASAASYPVCIPQNLGGGASAQFFAGDLAEIIIYDRALSDSELAQIELYLGLKYDCYGTESSASASSESSESSGFSDSSGSSGSSDSSDSSLSSLSSDSSPEPSSSASSESSNLSDSSSSEPSDSSSSESSDSSSSESSESSSSESSLSSSPSQPSASSSSESSCSCSSCYLQFINDPILAPWVDGYYDASNNLETNCSPIAWGIGALAATINQDGLVTFGNIGQWASIGASHNPEDEMALAICKVDILRDFFVITDTIVTVLPGERVSISYNVNPGNLQILSVSWSIQGRVVKDFNANNQRGAPDALTFLDLQQPSVSVAWHDWDGDYEVSCIVSVQGPLGIVFAFTGKTTIRVDRPVMPLVAVPGTVKLIGVPPIEEDLLIRQLVLGGNPDSVGDDVGIKFGTTAPNQGQIQWVQIGAINHSHLKLDGTADSNAASGLDGKYPYSADEDTADMPGSPCNDFYSKTTTYDEFTMWLMFKPNKPLSIWVPIKQISWRWSGTAVRTPSDTWTLESQMHTVTLEQDTVDFPQWTTRIPLPEERQW